MFAVNINNIPADIVLCIFQYLSSSDVCSCAMTAKYLNIIATSLLWRRMSLRITPCIRGTSLLIHKPSEKHRVIQQECRAYEIMTMLKDNPVAFANFDYTTELELDFSLLCNDMCTNVTSALLAKIERNYKRLRTDLSKHINRGQLNDLKIIYPELRQPQNVFNMNEEWAIQMTRILVDIPDFVAELVERSQVKNVHLIYHSSGNLGQRITDEFQPMLQHIAKLNQYLTDLDIQISSELLKYWHWRPTSLLQSLTLRYDRTEDRERSDRDKILGWEPHLGIWSDLRRTRLETLKIVDIIFKWPILLPTTITNLTIKNGRNIDWTLKVAFFNLPNLQHLTLKERQTRDKIHKLPRDFFETSIVCTKLQTVYFKYNRFEARFLSRIASSCPHVTSLKIKIVHDGECRGHDIRDFFLLDRGHVPRSAITLQIRKFRPHDYGLEFIHGFDPDILHVVYIPSPLLDDKFCDFKIGWELHKYQKYDWRRFPRTVIFRQDERIMESIDVIIIENDPTLPGFDSLDARGMEAEDAAERDFGKIYDKMIFGENVIYWKFLRMPQNGISPYRSSRFVLEHRKNLFE